ncbi:MAG: hypothetical protein AAF518_05345 [Spirochaetota bacterium]
MKNLPVLTFMLLLLFSLLFLVLEDLLWLDSVFAQQTSNYTILKLGRLLIACSLAALLALLIYPFASSYMHSLRLLRYITTNSIYAISQKEIKSYAEDSPVGKIIYEAKQSILQEKQIVDSYIRALHTNLGEMAKVTSWNQFSHEKIPGFAKQTFGTKEQEKSAILFLQSQDGILGLAFTFVTMTSTILHKLQGLLTVLQQTAAKTHGFTSLQAIVASFSALGLQPSFFSLLYYSQTTGELWYTSFSHPGVFLATPNGWQELNFWSHQFSTKKQERDIFFCRELQEEEMVVFAQIPNYPQMSSIFLTWQPKVSLWNQQGVYYEERFAKLADTAEDKTTDWQSIAFVYLRREKGFPQEARNARDVS